MTEIPMVKIGNTVVNLRNVETMNIMDDDEAIIITMISGFVLQISKTMSPEEYESVYRVINMIPDIRSAKVEH